MKQLITLLKALRKLKLRTLYHLILRASVNESPQIKVLKTENGYFSGLENDALFQLAIKQGSNEPHFESFAKLILLPKDVVVDLGGNIGTHSIIMSKIVYQGKVYTFEPQSLTYSILQNNLLLNKCDNVSAYRFAILNENHKTISMRPFSYVGPSINNGALRVDPNGFMGDFALTRTLDSFNFDHINFIKIDIQGSEVKALQGAKSTISKCRPYMLIEIEQIFLLHMGTTTKELIELIFSFDYALYKIVNNYSSDHICIPIEKADHFERVIVKKLDFKVSSKIYGRQVEAVFERNNDNNYKELIIK